MNPESASTPQSYWPQVVLATVAVVFVPLLIISGLEASGRLQSPVASIFLAILSSIAVASAGSAYWTRRNGSKDLVFGDLMVWSWLRRMRTERRVIEARHALGLDRRSRNAPAELSPERQAEILERLASSLEARDLYTHGHSRRVTRHSHMIAKQMGLPREQVAKVRAAAAMHDVGKLNIPRAILNKSGKLSDEEFDLIKRHPADGAEMVAGVGDADITAMVRHHHERLDGTGYPDGLAGNVIPMGARIIAVADTFDAITSSRPYRPARQHKQAISILKEEAGRQLDPDAVNAFRDYYSGRRSIAWWALVTTAFQRLVASLAGPIESASASSIGQGAVAVAASAALGTSLISPVAQPDRQSERDVGHTRSSHLIQSASFRAPSTSVEKDLDLSDSPLENWSGSGGRHELALGPAGGGTPAGNPGAGQPGGSDPANQPESEPAGEAGHDTQSPREDSAAGGGSQPSEEPGSGNGGGRDKDNRDRNDHGSGSGSDEEPDDDGDEGNPEDAPTEPDEDSEPDSNSGSGSGSSGNSGSSHGLNHGPGSGGD